MCCCRIKTSVMRKVIAIISIFLLMGIGQNCRTVHYVITDIRFHLAKIEGKKHKEKQHIHYDCTSSVKDELVFVISYYTEIVAQNSFLDFGNTCYAFTSPTKIDNPLLEETFSLKFDKSFVYKGEVIPEGTNLFDLETILQEIDVYENYNAFCSMGADNVIDFSQAFFDESVFEKTEYGVNFSCKTSDGKEFNKSIIITFETDV